jgi:FKBP-type peptidyl-prolyl cis-trans isomerase SlyD
MVLQGFDDVLAGKEVGKEYTVDLPANKAFGERNSSMVKIIPLKLFQSKGIMPYPGLSLNMDGLIARISAVSGGRVITDFNNPLAGKDVVYTFKVKRAVAEDKEKLSCLVEVYFREEAEKAIKSIEGKKAKIKLSNKAPKKALDTFTQKAKELLGMEVNIESA